MGHEHVGQGTLGAGRDGGAAPPGTVCTTMGVFFSGAPGGGGVGAGEITTEIDIFATFNISQATSLCAQVVVGLTKKINRKSRDL